MIALAAVGSLPNPQSASTDARLRGFSKLNFELLSLITSRRASRHRIDRRTMAEIPLTNCPQQTYTAADQSQFHCLQAVRQIFRQMMHHASSDMTETPDSTHAHKKQRRVEARSAEVDHNGADGQQHLNQYRLDPKNAVPGKSATALHVKAPAAERLLHNYNRAERLPSFDLPEAPPGTVSPDSGVRIKLAPDADVLEISNMTNRSAPHATPDAVVRIPKDFDPSKPIHLLIYNHGWYDNVSSSYRSAHLGDAMANAEPNTILVLPEWQAEAGAANGKQGAFTNHDMFQNMLTEIFQKTPALKGKSLNDVDTIDIISHSAGYGPTESELYQNEIARKVTSVTLLDSLYDNKGFDPWIQDNLADLSSGAKQFNNIFYGTVKYSEQLSDRIKKMLTTAKLPTSSIFEDDDVKDGKTTIGASVLSGHSIVVKYSNATIDKLDPHMSLPNIYTSVVEEAIKTRRSAGP